MFKDEKIAAHVNNLMLECRSKLSQSMSFVRENCNSQEANEYRKALGKVMGYMIIDIMEPIYKEHPDMRPPELSDSEEPEK